MRIEDEEQYEDFAAEYQFQIVRMVDAALRKTALPEADRRAACEQFVFDLAMLHDQGDISVDGKSRRPVLAFRSSDTLAIPNEHFDLHEYADGNVAEYFEGQQDAS